MTTDARVDAYIENAQPFAKPILQHLRGLLQKASPEITETVKWSCPVFEYNGLLCAIAAFRQHCAFSFFKAKQMKEALLFNKKNEAAAGQFGKITSLAQLPPDDVIIDYIREAMKMNDSGIKKIVKKPSEDRDIVMPEGLAKALEASSKAAAVFEKLSYSHKNEYIDWIGEAKTDVTRNKRLATTIEWLEEGKRRNWKYEKRGQE